MLNHDQSIPEETQEQNQFLIQDLRRYYNTRAEDNTSLARIHARLLEKTAKSLPVTRDHEVAQPPLQLQTQRDRNTRRKFAQVLAKDRPRYRSLGTLAAAVLLVALVGSFALLLHLGQGTGALEHGWSLAAKFSGTGNQTITRQNIEVGQKFGWRIICTNTQEGVVAIKYNLGSGSTACSANISTQLGPVGIATSPIAFPPIQTIEVTTNASTSWELFFFRATDYHPLTVNTADWHPLLSEMDGTGNSNETLGNTSLPRTLALQFVCHGTGDIQISLLPNGVPDTSEIAGAHAPCNGQTNFDVTDIAGQSEKVFQVQITTGADNDWQVLLAGCTNGKPHCGITTVTPTSTP
jgi:hypothetical protein